MARLDVFPNPGKGGQGFVVVVQAPLLDYLKTRVVVPLVSTRTAPPPIRDVNPIFEILGEPHVLLTQSIASVPATALKGRIASLDSVHEDVTRALDFIMLGF